MRLLIALAVLAVAGCSSTAPVLEDAGRPADGLLTRPDVQAVVDLQVRRDGEALTALLTDPDSVIRARAAFALGSVQAPDAVAALRTLLDDPVPAVRADAAFALGQTADSTAGVALAVSLRREATPDVTRELLDALGKVGGHPDLEAVLGALLTDDLEADRALALARFGMRDVTSTAWADWLGRHLEADDPAVRENAAYALTRSPVDAWRTQGPAIRSAFDVLEGGVARAHLARALGRLEDETDVDRLAGALAADPDWRTRVNAAQALRAISGTAARGALARAVDDPNPHVAMTAASALAVVDPVEAARLGEIALEDAARPWQVVAALLPSLAPSRPDLVMEWADRQSDPFAQALAVRALAASDDGAALTRLFTAAASDDTRLAAAGLSALRERWAVGGYGARRFFQAFAQGVARGDLATTSIAAPALADSAFRPLGAGNVLRQAYASLEAPADIEPMSAILSSLGALRDGTEIDFLVRVILEGGHPTLRLAARDALNDRLVDGVEVDVTNGDARPATTTIDWNQLAAVGPKPRLVLETDQGEVMIELDTEAAPQTVQRITTTAAGGRYDGVPFHRVVANFVVQGGDYTRRDGYGGPETAIRSEFTRIRYETGTIGMASSGKDTEGSQFFVTHSPQPHLDGRYTAFGRVLEGQDVVDAIMQGDLVQRARVIRDRTGSRPRGR